MSKDVNQLTGIDALYTNQVRILTFRGVDQLVYEWDVIYLPLLNPNVLQELNNSNQR